MVNIPRTVIIPDIHGSDTAFGQSLQHAGTADQIVTLGDYFDRGDQNRAVCDRVLQLRDTYAERYVPIAGNHDKMLRLAVETQEAGDVWDWFKNGGSSFLAEIAASEGMKKMKKKYVFPVDLPSGMTEQKWRDYIKEGQFSGVDFRAAFDWLCHDVREGKLAQLFPLLQIVTEVRSCCWAVHADLDKKVVLKGTHATNAKFRKFSERGFRGLPATLNNMLDTRIGEWGGLEQEDARLAMGRNQIGLVFQGHTFDKSGIPQVKTLRPVTIASLDVGISHAITSSPAEWGYGAVNEDGSVVVQSSVMKKPQQIGQIGEDHIFRVQ